MWPNGWSVNGPSMTLHRGALTRDSHSRDLVHPIGRPHPVARERPVAPLPAGSTHPVKEKDIPHLGVERTEAHLQGRGPEHSVPRGVGEKRAVPPVLVPLMDQCRRGKAGLMDPALYHHWNDRTVDVGIHLREVVTVARGRVGCLQLGAKHIALDNTKR